MSERDRRSGRYDYAMTDESFARVCARCGRTFGQHYGAAPHDFDGAEDGGEDCRGFKPLRKKRTAAQISS